METQKKTHCLWCNRPIYSTWDFGKPLCQEHYEEATARQTEEYYRERKQQTGY